MMNYEEFKNEVMANMKNYLTEEYQDYDMKFETIKKSSGYEYEALMIGPKDRKMSVIPALNLNEAYKKLQDGIPFDEVMDKLADIRMNASLPEFNKEDMFDYDKIKNRIFPRLVNTEANAGYLADKPHKDIEDLSILYAVRVSENDSGFAEAIITDDLAQMWGVDQTEIHDRAMDNIAERPPLFKNIEEVLFGGRFGDAGDIEIEDIEPNNYDIPFFVLTNQQKTKGAVMAIDPKTMGRITAKLGDVYIIPSSVDETLVVPKEAVDDVNSLVEMVKQVNANEVKPEDQLSNNVYEYDTETQSLKIAGSGPEQQDSVEMKM
ncbi:hypothetical protein SAMN05216413_2624 [Ruminococcaceae bacterium KH2T8]|nr:hypothetical protein SAMN05216413_2624 [Ruminococcaceae bacterium KH2T8]